MRPSLLVLSFSCLVTACDPFGCKTEARFADYVGRLGDSVVAVASTDQREIGHVYVGLGQWRGGNDQRQVTLSLNYWSFADAVSQVRLYDHTNRSAPLATFDRSQGYAVRDSFFNFYPALIGDRFAWDRMWNAFERGDGELLLVPAGSKPEVRARLRRTQGTGYQDACT